MDKFILLVSLAVLAAAVSPTLADDAKSPLDFKLKGLDGKPVDLSKFKGQVVLIVNVASECGYTPQYEGLEAIHTKYKDQGFAVLGFPANEFGAQEPGSDAEIRQFCTKNYGVDFPMFSKIVVKGEGIAPLYEHLTSAKTNPKFAGPIAWNFEKFLVARNGQVVARFKSGVEPESEEMIKAVEAQLKKEAPAKNGA